MSQVVDDLNRAAEVLAVRGWTQKTYEDADGHVCVYGALAVAIWGDIQSFLIPTHRRDQTWMDNVQRLNDAQDAISTVLKRKTLSLWNDAPERTQKEVHSTILKAVESQMVTATAT